MDFDQKAIQALDSRALMILKNENQSHILTLAEKLSKKIIFVLMAPIHKWSQK